MTSSQLSPQSLSEQEEEEEQVSSCSKTNNNHPPASEGRRAATMWQLRLLYLLAALATLGLATATTGESLPVLLLCLLKLGLNSQRVLRAKLGFIPKCCHGNLVT
ncbi:hypothetical protein C0J52_09973 [Blattella germanica]|nr:hypothetical protein C0J52_09973 [Blattella germanica]